MRAKRHYIASHEVNVYIVGDRIFMIADEYTYQPGAEKAILKNEYNVHEIEKGQGYQYMFTFMRDHGIKNMFTIERYRQSLCDWGKVIESN